MSEFNESWSPGFGEIITWFGVDKNYRVAVMVNNCFGQLPKVLLETVDIDRDLDRVSEYMWGESKEFPDIPEGKGGRTILDFYSWCSYKGASRGEVEDIVAQCSHDEGSEYSFSSLRGYFVFHAIEGDREGVDYPVGYGGKGQMGDYFRYLFPTVLASIDDFPEPLRRVFVVAPDVDFEKDRFFESSRIDEFFVGMYSVI